MDLHHLMTSTVAFILAVALHLPTFCYGLSLNVEPEVVVAKQGESIQVNCSTNKLSSQILDFKWQAIGHDLKDDVLFRQIRLEKFVVSLLIPDAQPENTGVYRCKIHTSDARHTSKVVYIRVKKRTEFTTRPGSLRLDIVPNRLFAQTLVVQTNENVQVNCSSIKTDILATNLRWEVKGVPLNSNQENVRQVRLNDHIVSLQITEVHLFNSGIYTCRLYTSVSDTEHIELKVQVTGPSTALENTRKFCRFICGNNIAIDCTKKCDGITNCPLGEDELGCQDICDGKFRCTNSRCVDYSSVCDGMNHCEDWSDEERCLSATTSAVPVDVDSTEEEDNQMIWLKTTVYTVIACTVGIVFLISVIVIAIFRIKMKRAAVRRTLRQAERRRRHSGRGESQNNSRPQRTEPVEHDPFISSPSPTHFGNIIVNVNNGVQYVPNADFTVGVQSPPSYSEVMAETGRVDVRRNSPPPEYSTIDRNPNRMSEIQDSELHIQLLSDDGSSVNVECPPNNLPETNTVLCNTRDLQHSVSSGDNHSLTRREENAITSTSANTVTTSDGTSSLGRRENRGQTSRHNVRSVGSPRRPKQLKVLDGQIVLDDDSSNTSSPETVNRNTQTNPADISSLNQNLKPAQIQVQAGQIVLASQDTEPDLTVNPSESEGAFAQGQLDVKDGHIVFRPS